RGLEERRRHDGRFAGHGAGAPGSNRPVGASHSVVWGHHHLRECVLLLRPELHGAWLRRLRTVRALAVTRPTGGNQWTAPVRAIDGFDVRHHEPPDHESTPSSI